MQSWEQKQKLLHAYAYLDFEKNLEEQIDKLLTESLQDQDCLVIARLPRWYS